MADKRSPERFPEITTGNAVRDGQVFNGWFVGDLGRWSQGKGNIPGLSTIRLRDTRGVEIKWGTHQKGEGRSSGWAPASKKITLSILVSGKFCLKFRNPGDRDHKWEHTLVERGDYAIWDGKVEHNWIAEEESVILTIRWKEQI